MIAEALLYATALADRDCRRVGLVGDAVALWSRAGRCRRAWSPHQERCEAVVRRSIARLPHGGVALVLGSGLLRDVALPALMLHFDAVLLVDAVHLIPARWRAKRLGAEIAVTDLTGCAASLLGRANGRQDPLEAFRNRPIRFVLSANCLSQLPMSVGRYVERHGSSGRAWILRHAEKGAQPVSRSAHEPSASFQTRPLAAPPDDACRYLARRIVDWHLADILSLGVPACLLTDTRYRRVARNGSVLDETDLLAGRILPPPDESWDWEVAPRGEIDRHTSTLHRVHAYEDLARSMADADGGVRYTRQAT